MQPVSSQEISHGAMTSLQSCVYSQMHFLSFITVDSALLRFHGIKITEINRIVRELWNLTYKGEDISNIELVSGQEKNAKKSYNYRVVSMHS